MSRLLQISDLNVSFKTMQGEKGVLHDVNIDVSKNEILAVVGESGSGKSVMSKAIMGLLGNKAAKSGQIYLHDSKLSDEPLEMVSMSRRQAQQIRGDEISMIFQDPMTSLNPLMTVGNQIAEAVQIHQKTSRAEAIEEAGRMLDLVRVPSGRQVLGVYPHQLSGGMRQRVMIAMALACKPKLLIADEPTTALDVTIQAQILGLIRELQTELGMGVIFITHDMGVVHEVADRVAVMYHGDIVETGTLNQVFLEPKHAYTKALLKAAPKLGSMRGRAVPHSFPVLTMEEELKGNTTLVEIPGSPVDYSKAPLLDVDRLHVVFPRKHNFFGKVTHQVHAVNDVSFKLWKGETLGIVGESGSGKSTIGNAILGLLEEASGGISYQGIDLLDPTREQRKLVKRDISFIFQDPLASLNPQMTIGECVEEPFIIHHPEMSKAEREKQAKALLNKVGIKSELYRHYPHEFSGGMLQRVNIARALTTQPKIIVADESVSALDVSVQATVLNLMLALQKEFGISFIFISHDMAVIERVCHRVAVLTKGQLVEIGHRQEVFEDTKHSYTQKLLAAIPSIDTERSAPKQFELLTDDIPDPIFPVGESPLPIKLVEHTTTHFSATE
ncbi:dipeptide ABC transporter ATP-binding protein [Vibrio breoganii]|nr:ABC transporter ATP-binding protein [Vibrio breoganii]OCH72837.1 glutathione ABC transporter ATP-binding protein [Vibrio breoganii]PMK75971.1 glutathione ABC transporter ATP-binding protein [Vibrio breoganii]PML12018.1 glutathione ABC transporter ATP-binding protein [Vibrio breoganii]PML27758.1 glutathione ABC transporter ATP-binding protein [Vibrio breoganii]PMM83763.1 glutathione ABC transporter ATP-binding protein [Vibrio breoganii]